MTKTTKNKIIQIKKKAANNMEKGWMMVWTVQKEYFAELIKKMLADNDIQAVSINKKDSSYTSFGDIEIYVKEEHHLKARTLIKEFEE